MEYRIDHVTKIEGHASLNIRTEGREVRKVELNVFEGSRYFESLVLGRHYKEISELTARICGICSPSHRIASLMAVEDAIGITPSDQTIILRELMVNGAHLESHGLHAILVSLVDYMGYKDPFEMMGKQPELVKAALEIKRVGNLLVRVIGGREIQPISPVINGFSKLPGKKDAEQLLTELRKIRPSIIRFADMFSKIKYPDYWRECNHYAISSESYSLIKGNPNSVHGHSFKAREFGEYVKEKVVPYSTAKHSQIMGETYMVGALPRINVNSTKLAPKAKEYLFKLPNYNPFMNDYAQAIEMVNLVDDSINILSGLEIKKETPRHEFKPGKGYSSTEAPRGTLYHHYEFNKEGRCVHADILTPTAQNLPNIENDVKHFLPQVLESGDKKVLWWMERLIRAYDPCISCSTHFLKLKIDDKTISTG